MSEMTVWQEPEAQAPTRTSSLVEWAREADAAYTLAQRLTETAFCPQQFKGKPADAAAAMLAGSEVGLSPLAALQAFDVIQGRAAPRAITLRAVVQSCGHEMVLVESTATRCRMTGRRKGSDQWQSVTWTMDRARDLQLTGKDQWKKQPTAMLLARATSELARLVAADAILGIGYSAEEAQDGGVLDASARAETVEAEPASTGKRTLSRRKPPAEPVEEPAEEVQDAEVADETKTPEPMTKRTRGQLFALFGKKGIPEGDQLSGINHVTGQAYDSRGKVTEADALLVIERLKERPDVESTTPKSEGALMGQEYDTPEEKF